MKNARIKRTSSLLGALAVSVFLTACSSSMDREPTTNYVVKSEYFSVRNDANEKLSSRLTRSAALNQGLTYDDSYHHVLLGHDVAVICAESSCSQASNLATLDYTVSSIDGTLVIKGKLINETGESTKSEGGMGWIKKSITKGATLHSQGTEYEEFELPITAGKSVTLNGPLGDKLVIFVE